MGVRADLNEIVVSGAKFAGIPDQPMPPVPKDPPKLGLDTLLSSGVAAAHEDRAIRAARFVNAMENGLREAGRGLEEVATSLGEIDRQGARSIEQLFPRPAPGTAGGP